MSQPVFIRAHPGEVAPLVVTAGDPARVNQIAEMLDEAQLVNDNRGLMTYTGSYNGKRVSVATHGMGGPSAAIVFEELLMHGATTILRLGSAAGIVPGLNIGDLVVPTGAAYLGGTISMYVPEGSLPAIPDFQVLAFLIDRCKRTSLKSVHGVVITTDAFYAEDPPFLQRWSKNGAIAVEMECATLFVLGLLKRFRTGSVLVISDNLVDHSQNVMVSSTALVDSVQEAGKVLLDCITHDFAQH